MQLKFHAAGEKKRKEERKEEKSSSYCEEISRQKPNPHQQVSSTNLCQIWRLSAWCSQSAAIPGPFGRHPHVQCYSLGKSPGNMLVKPHRMYLGNVLRKNKSNFQMPTISFSVCISHF